MNASDRKAGAAHANMRADKVRHGKTLSIGVGAPNGAD